MSHTLKTRFKQFALAAVVSLPALAIAAALPGKPAPNFSEKDASGATQSLSDYKGQWLVVEWFNKDCPYDRKHYDSGNMQKLQKKYNGKNVKWLNVISSAKGKQGYLEPAEAMSEAKSHNMTISAPMLLDTDGSMGRAYGAKTTPHMFVINPEGVVVYAGAIDSDDSWSPSSIPGATNYVAAALDAGMSGKPIKVASSRAYGCSVKY